MRSSRIVSVVVTLIVIACGLAVAQPPPEAPLLPGLDIPCKAQRVSAWWTEVSNKPIPWPHASFAPDGSRICFEFDRPVMMGPSIGIRLWDVPNSVTLVQELVTGFRNPHCPVLSPDGTTLLFLSRPEDAPEGENSAIWATDLTGSTPRRMIPKGNFRPYSPAWSPDGDKIAFVKAVPNDPADSLAGFVQSLAFVDVKQPGAIAREVAISSALIEPPSVGALRYSPDGRWLACTAYGGLAVIDVETATLYQLFDDDTTTLSFSPQAYTGMNYYVWLPDSQRLLVTVGAKDAAGRHKRIWMVNLAGEARQLGEGQLLGGPPRAHPVHLQGWAGLSSGL